MKHNIVAITMLVMGSVFTGTYIEVCQADVSEEKEAHISDNHDFFEDLDDRYSYAYGAELARNFQTEGVELDADMVAEAIKDVFANREMKMPDGEIIATIEIYQEIHKKKKEAERVALGEKNKQESEAFLSENAKREDVVVTESGLQYKVITEGTGDYTPAKEDEVTVHYRGTFIDGTEFDSTYKRNESYTVKVKRLIEGWSEALQLMSEGSKWELYIPSDIAYGEEGSGDYVGPNAALIFEVELLEVNKIKES